VSRIVFLSGLVALLATLAPSPADALQFPERPDWVFGIGFGYGTGNLQNGDGTDSEYRGGAAPQVRLGRMLHPNWMVSANWESWLTEFGEEPLKLRRTLQNLALAVAWFPGSAGEPIHGLFVRAGAGMGWAGTGAKEAEEGGKQEKGERLDEWGVGVFGEVGYELWIARGITTGLMVNYNWFDIGERVVDRAHFTSVATFLNAYF
jgi:hypothetical protein